MALEVSPSAEEEASTPVGEENDHHNGNGFSPNGESTIDLERKEISLNTLADNVDAMIGSFHGVKEKIIRAKEDAEHSSANEVERVQLFIVSFGRSLLKDPLTRNLAWREQATGFKQLMGQAKNQRAMHVDVRERTKHKLEKGQRKEDIDLLGQGGFGDVYLAEEMRAVVKVLRPKKNVDPERAAMRHEREIRAYKRLNEKRNEVLVQIAEEKKHLPEMSDKERRKAHDQWKLREQSATVGPLLLDEGESDGEKYMVLERISGEDLSDLLSREGKLPLKKAAKIFAELLRQTKTMHEADIVHRDLKPQNIKILAEGKNSQTRILDYGLSRRISTDQAIDTIDQTMTQDGAVIGTPLYMSPDQALEGSTIAGSKSPNVDFYSLGVMFVESVTGENPRKQKFDAHYVMEIMHWMGKEKKDQSLLLKGLEPYGLQAVEATKALLNGNPERAQQILDLLAVGKEMNFGHSKKKISAIVTAIGTAIMGLILGLKQMDKKDTDDSIKNIVTASKDKEPNEPFHAVEFPEDEKEKSVNIRLVKKGPDGKIYTLDIPSGFNVRQGGKLRVTGGVISRPKLHEFQGRPIDDMTKKMKDAYVSRLIGTDPKSGKEISYIAFDDGQEFIVADGKIIPYTNDDIRHSEFISSLGEENWHPKNEVESAEEYRAILNQLDTSKLVSRLYSEKLFSNTAYSEQGQAMFHMRTVNRIKSLKEKIK